MIGILVVVILILVLIYYSSWRNKSVEKLVTHTPVEVAHGEKNYIKLYDNFKFDEPAYENSTPGHINFALRGNVKGIDINLPVGEDTYLEIWNVRAGQTIASTAADFYENTIYTTPSYLRGVSPNLTLIARVMAGERYVSDSLPPIHKVLIVGRL